MAKMPTPAKDSSSKKMPPSANDADEDENMGGAAEAGEDEGGDEEHGDDEGSEVLLTVMKNKDGTYELIEGDEDEDEDEEGEEGEDEEEPEEGETSEAGEGEGEPKGETFDSVGALLKGILDLVKKDEAEGSGEGTDDENFAAGYEGGAEASPKKPPAIAQKY